MDLLDGRGMLNEEVIQAGVGGRWAVRVMECVTSTNDELKARVVGETPEVLFAEHQTAGRGRRDHVWEAPPGQDLLMSVACRPSAEAAQWPRATTAAAVAVCEAIESETPLAPLIKWPNDIVVNGRKVAGILAESCSPGGRVQLVLGIGLNVNRECFEPFLSEVATSLRLALGERVHRPLDREALAVSLLERLAVRLFALESGFPAILEEARNRSALLGRQVRASVRGVRVFGRAIDLDREGGLVLQLSDGSRAVLTSAEEVRPAGEQGGFWK